MRGFYIARKVVDKKLVIENGETVPAFEDAQLPEYQTRLSAGADFFCAKEVVIPSLWKTFLSRVILNIKKKSADVKYSGDKDIIKRYFAPTVVHTGVKASMEEDEVLELFNRSSNPKNFGLILANGVGVIDADYFENENNDGEILFTFYNLMPWSVKINVGERIGQGVFKKYLRPIIGLRVKDVTRKSGLGSTNE